MEKTKIKKHALVFDRYLDTLGGGERYTLTFAKVLRDLGYSVDLAWRTRADLEEAQRRFGLDLSGISVNEKAWHICSSRSSITKRLSFTRRYGLIFWVSDGSLPFLFGQNNLVHFQVPFTNISRNRLLNSLKASFINKFIYNSDFTRSVLERYLPSSKGVILYPPIDTKQFKAGKKENIILSVARFASPMHSKRQDILIEAFKLFSEKNKQYKLVLAGGLFGSEKELVSLKKKAKGLKVDFVINPSFAHLQKLYAKARFFWHAAGYGVDEVTHPEKVEHFGMATVEAMSAGCIPIVIAKGGQKEVITNDCGFLVNTPEEFSGSTLLLTKDKKLIKDYSENAIDRSSAFSISEFAKTISGLL